MAERYRFRQRRQSCGESVKDYYTELKKLSSECDFGANLEDNLRDQLVCGLKSDVIRQRLFAEDSLSFSQAVKIACSLEAAERDAASVEVMGAGGGGASAHSNSAVHALTSSRARGPSGSAAQGSYGRGPSGARRWASPDTARSADQSAQCEACGARSHGIKDCRFRRAICSKCGKEGHLRRVCPAWAERAGHRWAGNRGYKQSKSLHHLDEGVPAQEEDDSAECEEELNQLCLSGYKPVSLPINVDGHRLRMELDTGSAISCISKETYDSLFSNRQLESYNLVLKFYDGSRVRPLGLIKPNVKWGNITKQLELFVIEGGTTSLLGRHWLTELKVPLLTSTDMVEQCNQLADGKELNMLLSRHKELFSGGLGRFTGGKVRLRVREDAVPVFCRARPLPFALKERVDAELDAMLRDGVIEPVDCSDWATPLVPVSKADGGLRICADYKITLNPALLVDRYPLPRFDDLLMTLNKSVIFSKCDLSQAYNQLELDESAKYTVVNTHRGLYRYKRLVYGLSSSSGIFQRTLSNLLKGIPFTGVFIDDVIVGGRNIEEHLKSLEEVLRRLSENGLKLKKNKCEFMVDEVKYLGYIISKDGIKTDPEKVKTMVEMAPPENVAELRSFLGLVNFYGKFIKNMSQILAPLYELLKKDVSWVWSTRCKEAFDTIKRVLASSEVLAHYDEDKPLILTCDASGQGVGGVLTQPGARGERPVAYMSRTLSDAEKNYAQIQREALAIIVSLKKFHQYLYGRKFLLRTDHKPLVSIFGSKSGVPPMAASRLQRWAVILSAYSYDIEYVTTKENIADGFSRLPLKVKEYPNNQIPEQTYLHQVQDALLLDASLIKRETARDPILSRVVSFINDGWPQEIEIQSVKPYFNRRNELYVEMGCIMWGHRVVVPESCRKKVLAELHEPHMGIVKTKSIARSYVWWPGVDEGVEATCRACAVCAAESDAPRAHQPSPWPWHGRPWTRLHVDYMGPIFNQLYLVVVDATSKWMEIFAVPSTGATHAIEKLSQLFAQFGLCKQIISDNGPPFSSTEFELFTRSNGIDHIFSAPYHPASNGAAENAVKTLKKVIKKAKLENSNVSMALQKFLLHYRNTEHCTTGDSPAQILMGRSLRTRLDVIKPDREKKVLRAQRSQVEGAGGSVRELKAGDTVWCRQYQPGKKWVAGEVSERLGTTDYTVRREDGSETHRHIDQLRQRSSLSVAPPPCDPVRRRDSGPRVSGACDYSPSLSDSIDNTDHTVTKSPTPSTTVNLPQSPPTAKPIRSTRNQNPVYK
ncbi:hypothetical protein JYU34_015388 [Plutella xylostella]|uniref:RNA-directed DNA polymerase n=1 Tax=Plutella xylostella TaxID=51655 RepID=A0ABQ7Q701_PLUXY|nr:hypothetical protein JYU34_015388 [Plutella xylostella]